jgi:hypothetical protein
METPEWLSNAIYISYKLNKLLSDRQMGVDTWHTSVHNTYEDLKIVDGVPGNLMDLLKKMKLRK